MTKLKFALVILLSAPLLAVAQTAEKTMLKSFNLSGKDQIQLQLPGTIDVKTWDKPTVQIQITVALPNGNAAMLNELANVGRYNLTAKNDPTSPVLTITSDNLAKVIKVKGLDLKELITYQVFAPKDTPVKISDSATAAIEKK